MQRRRKQLLQTAGSADVLRLSAGMADGDKCVSVTEASGARRRWSEDHTIHRALPALLGTGSSHWAALWLAGTVLANVPLHVTPTPWISKQLKTESHEKAKEGRKGGKGFRFASLQKLF